MNKKFIAVIIFIFLLTVPVFSQDFGLVLNQKAVFASLGDGYTVSAIPWFASPLGKNAGLYLSCGFSVSYEDNEWNSLFEIYRFEAGYTPVDNLTFTLGRQNFHDSFGFIMTGLFDGVSIEWGIRGGRLNLGLFYTGLLYKKNVSILLSEKDLINYFDNDIYFASRRITGGINYEKTSIFDTHANFWLSGIFQFDVNDTNDRIHSQYIASKIAVPLTSSLNLQGGGAFSLLQEEEIRFAFALSADLQLLFPIGSIPSLFELGGRYSCGRRDKLAAFTPITGEALGRVLRPNLSGIAIVQSAYTIRPHHTFFTELYAAYLFRTDTVSFVPNDINTESGSPLLGTELCLGFSWMPFSDIILNLNGGVFLPQKGAFTNDAKLQYRIELTAGISL